MVTRYGGLNSYSRNRSYKFFIFRKSQIATQSARYLEIWREYSNLQVEFREKAKAKLGT